MIKNPLTPANAAIQQNGYQRQHYTKFGTPALLAHHLAERILDPKLAAGHGTT